jgi:hypothetical protein
MKYRINRRDNGSKELEAYAKTLGFGVAHIGGDWDCDLYLGSRVIPCDWKSATAPMTPKQQKLILAGFPLRFVSSAQQLEQLRAELSK